MKKRLLYWIAGILILSTAGCHFPLSVTDDESVVDGYVAEGESTGGGSAPTLTLSGSFNTSGLSDLTIDDLRVRGVNSFTNEEKNSAVQGDGTFSLTLPSLEGSQVSLYGYVDTDGDGDYDDREESLFVITQTPGDQDNEGIRIEQIYKLSGTLTRHADWSSDPLLAKVDNTTYYLTYYQQLNGEDYTIYMLENQSLNLEAGPAPEEDPLSETFLAERIQLYGAQTITADSAADFTVRKVSGTVSVNDPSGYWEDYPLNVMIGSSDYNTAHWTIAPNCDQASYGYTLYTRDGNLKGWIYVDLNYSGTYQGDEPADLTVAWNGGTDLDTTTGDVINFDFTINQ